jgi:hypothetical protein
MTRRPDWYTRYVDFIEEMRQTPFEWGVNDCGPAWAGRVVEVITDRENPVADAIGRYKSARGGVRLMRKMGYTDLREAASDMLGQPYQHPSRGVIGDIALIKTPDGGFGYSFGIVNGERVFFRREDGIGTVDLLETECVFNL